MFPVPTTAAFEVVVTFITKATHALRNNNKKWKASLNPCVKLNPTADGFRSDIEVLFISF